jgi:uncharacterized protein involved in exopolysaccharide biosynthesis
MQHKENAMENFEDGNRQGNGNGHGNGHSNGHGLQSGANAGFGTARDLVGILFRRRQLMLRSFAVMFLGVLVAAFFVVAHTYQSEMKIMVKHDRQDPVVTAEISNAPQAYTDGATDTELNSEVELLRSRDLLEQVVKETGLDQKRSLLSFGSTDPAARTAKAVAKLSAALNIELLKKTNIIRVAYTAKEPNLAAHVLTALSAGYLAKHIEVRRPAGALQFFEQQTDHYRKGLADTEVRLAAFSQDEQTVAGTLTRDTQVAKLVDFDATLRTTQASITESERRIKDLETQLASTPQRMETALRKTDAYTLLENLQSGLLALEVKRTELLTKFDPSYRSVQEVDQEIAQTKTAIAEAEKSPTIDQTTDRDPTFELLREELAKAKADLAGYQGRAGAMAAAIGGYRESLVKMDQKALAQGDLLREAKADEDNFLLYMHKREEARISDAMDQRRLVNVALVDEPAVPAMPTTSPWLFALLGTLLAAAVSIILAFMAEYFDPSFRTPDQVTEFLDVPVFASIPKNGN